MFKFRIRCPCCGERFELFSKLTGKIKALLFKRAEPNLYLYDENVEYGLLYGDIVNGKGGG